MKKKIYLILLGFISILNLNAQSPIFFHLNPGGYFTTENGEDYAVVSYEDKTAHELYQMIATNISLLYNDPSKVMSGVDDSTIKVRAYCNSICTKKLLMTFYGGGYYQLNFQFKEGKIRVSAPRIEQRITFDSVPPTYGEFKDIVKNWYNKKGEIKDKNKKDVFNLESQINVIINEILGLGDSNYDTDW